MPIFKGWTAYEGLPTRDEDYDLDIYGQQSDYQTLWDYDDRLDKIELESLLDTGNL